MYGKNFTYDGHSSEEFGIVIGGISRKDDIPLALERQILKGEMNRYRNSPNHMGAQYVDVLNFQIVVMKNVCEYQNQKDLYFTEDEIDDIAAWLTSPDYPQLFHMYDYDINTENGTYKLLLNFAGINFEDPCILYFMDSINTIIFSGNIIQQTVNDSTITILRITYKEKIEESNNDEYIDVTIELDININDNEAVILIPDNLVNRFMNVDTIDIKQQTSPLKNNTYLKCNDNSWGSARVTNVGYFCVSSSDKYWNLKYDYFGIFTDIDVDQINGYPISLVLSFSCNSPFPYSQIHTYVSPYTEEDPRECIINVNTSERRREIWPIIHFYPNSNTNGKSFTISDGHESLTITPKITTEIVIDCKLASIKTIVANNESELLSFDQLGLEDVTNIYWPRLYHGENTLILSGEGTFSIEFREPRKVGAF